MSTYVGVKINMFETPTSIRYSHVFPLGCAEVRLFDMIVLGAGYDWVIWTDKRMHREPSLAIEHSELHFFPVYHIPVYLLLTKKVET